MCGIHFGTQKFAFRGMPFGVPRYVMYFFSTGIFYFEVFKETHIFLAHLPSINPVIT